MSGGVAYIWNRTGNVDYYINMDMVELTLLHDEEEASEPEGAYRGALSPY